MSESAKRVRDEILVVEDSRVQSMLLRELLEANGYDVRVARDGVEALAAVKAQQPSLVLSDIVMPEMDGFELCRQIKGCKELHGVPVLLLTTLSAPDDIICGLKCGANGFVTKPFESQFLLARIGNLLENRQIRDQTQSGTGIEIIFDGEKHLITAEKSQMIDLLLSTYETLVEHGRELERINAELQDALDTIKALQGMLPICAGCKKIRDDQNGEWHNLEVYIERHSEATFTHGLCPDCLKRLYPQVKHPPTGK